MLPYMESRFILGQACRDKLFRLQWSNTVQEYASERGDITSLKFTARLMSYLCPFVPSHKQGLSVHAFPSNLARFSLYCFSKREALRQLQFLKKGKC